MAFSEYLEEWGGKKVEEWTSEKGITDPEHTAYAVRTSYDGPEWKDIWAEFMADPRVGEISSLVIGVWDNQFDNVPPVSEVEAIVNAAEHLPHLNALFFGDILYEESEVSWIVQGDISPFFGAFPQLEHLGVRGGNGLTLGIPHHANLKSLTLQAGGLPSSVVDEVTAAELPALEHLEIWLGTDQYGGNTTVERIEKLLEVIPTRFPKLTYLGLRNSQIADDIAKVVANAPVLEQLETLDLSNGILSDDGAAALLESEGVKSLKKLDLHYHFMKEEMVARFQTLGIEVDTSDVQEGDEDGDRVWRYVSVGE
jgi:hypothetical protein